MQLQLFIDHLKGVKTGWGNIIFSDRYKGSGKLTQRSGMMVPTFKVLGDLIEILEEEGIDSDSDHNNSKCPHLAKAKAYDEIVNTQQDLLI